MKILNITIENLTPVEKAYSGNGTIYMSTGTRTIKYYTKFYYMPDVDCPIVQLIDLPEALEKYVEVIEKHISNTVKKYIAN